MNDGQANHHQTNIPSLSEAELDRLQIKWVMGKNRGIDCPLEVEDLAKLLDAKRVSWAVLGDLEKRKFLDDQRWSLRVEEWRKEKFEGEGKGLSKGVLKLLEKDSMRVIETYLKNNNIGWENHDDTIKKRVVALIYYTFFNRKAGFNEEHGINVRHGGKDD